MENAIATLIKTGMTEKEAIQEIREIANWYLRGTGRTSCDIQYATKCAIEDILETE